MREVFLLPHHIAAYMFVAAIAFLLFFGDWYVFDVMIFFGALLFFDFRRILARSPFVCVVSQCWLPINTFFSLTFPRCRRSVPMFLAVFSTFHVKHCCFLYEMLSLRCLFFTVSGAISCGFVVLSFRCLRVVTRFCAACASVVFYWRLSELDVVA